MHWYDRNGKPRHKIIGRNKKERETTLKDAKKYDYYPSVSTIIGARDEILGSGYHLEQYKLEKVLEAAYYFTEDCENYNDFCYKSMKESRVHMQEAAASGSRIHGLLEKYFKEASLINGEYEEIEPIVNFIYENFPNVDDWESEVTFCDAHNGFGGCIDLISQKYGILIDFKTKEKISDKTKAYESHEMQTAAYIIGSRITYPGQTKRYNLFISYVNTSELKLVQHCNFPRDWGRFEGLLRYWQHQNSYFGDKGVV